MQLEAVSVNQKNWKEMFDKVWTSDMILIQIEESLFTHTDYGIALLENIWEYYDEVWSEGKGYEGGFIKLYKRK
jgi:hypothetical protein